MFSNMSIMMSIFQFAFIDSIMTLYLNKAYGIHFSDSGYFFGILALGMFAGCYACNYSSKLMESKHMLMLGSIF